MPLEEIAAIFGDEDEVAIYQYELEIDSTTHRVKHHSAHEEHAEVDDERKADKIRETGDIESTPNPDR
jgi:hypothetical protein